MLEQKKYNHVWIYEHGYDTSPASRCIKQTDATCLYSLLEEFEQYLKGCGFNFDGHIEIVSDCEDID